MAKAVKLADIAEVVGVSIVTVSKALSDKPGVGPELRERIKKLAKEMGYMPVGGLRASRTGLTGNIGVLIPKRFVDNASFYWELYQRIVDCLSGKEYYSILELLERENEVPGHLPDMVKDDKVDGLIALGQTDMDYVRYLQEEVRLPLQFLDFYCSDDGFDTVISDGFYGMYRMTEYLKIICCN